MKNLLSAIICLILFWSSIAFGDGLLLPSNENYPKDLLKNLTSRINVRINGVIAETEVYQEFQNEWNQSTDAIYNFPLPADARATEIIYWKNDIAYKAILQVRQQETNPGTGEKPFVAAVNRYIGRNGIKILLKNIGPNEIQRIRLSYVSLLDFNQGVCSYKFPLNTSPFVNSSIEDLEIKVDIKSYESIVSGEISSHPGFQTSTISPNHLVLTYSEPKSYLSKDIRVQYLIGESNLSFNLYSRYSPDQTGHYNLVIRPPFPVPAENVIKKRVVFLLNISSSLTADQVSQIKNGLISVIDQLSSNDQFNIFGYNTAVSKWRSSFQPVSSFTISSAKTFITNLPSSGGSRLDLALSESIKQFPDTLGQDIILNFTNGKSLVDPKTIRNLNTKKSGIYSIAYGDDVDRERLEYLSGLNYGFVKYFSKDESISNGIAQVFNQIKDPVLARIRIQTSKQDITGLGNVDSRTIFSNSYSFVSGKYKVPEPGIFQLTGFNSLLVPQNIPFEVNLSSDTTQLSFVPSLFAKNLIDILEQQLLIDGETPALKDSLIKLSLDYGIRCRYTAYIADYKNLATTIEDPLPIPIYAGLKYNYPNPFNPSTTFRLFISAELKAKVKLLKVYNVIGQLVAVIDISKLGEGWQDVKFNATGFDGNPLASGLYLVQFVAGNDLINTIRIQLVK
ncbi:MAG: VWA domain-containing protein [Bacteroidetes bacterium]|nr:VWA domain-containing protein [Bacteroidota bacterium]